MKIRDLLEEWEKSASEERAPHKYTTYLEKELNEKN